MKTKKEYPAWDTMDRDAQDDLLITAIVEGVGLNMFCLRYQVRIRKIDERCKDPKFLKDAKEAVELSTATARLFASGLQAALIKNSSARGKNKIVVKTYVEVENAVGPMATPTPQTTATLSDRDRALAVLEKHQWKLKAKS